MKIINRRAVVMFIAMLMAFSSLSSIGIVSAAEQTYVPIFTQDFEKYTPYNSEDKSGAYGAALTEKLDCGTQTAYTGADVDGTNGLLSIQQEGEKKYLEGRAKKSVYPAVLYGLDKPVTGTDVVVEMNLAVGKSTLYFRPTFSDAKGGNVQEISNFVVLSNKRKTEAYAYDPETQTSVKNNPTKLKTDWCNVKIHFNMEKLTYQVFVTYSDGEGDYTFGELSLPTNGTNTQADTYDTRKFIKQIGLTVRCDEDSLTNTDILPIKLAKFTVAVPAPGERTDVFSQGFEDYTVYDKAAGTGTFGTAFNETISGATQAAIAANELHINGTQGLYSVQQEDNNKYFEARTQLNIIPSLGYQFDKPVTGDDIVIDLDYSLGGGIVYIVPTFSDAAGTDTKDNDNFIVMSWGGTTIYYYSANGNNGTYTPTPLTGWAKAEVHINMEKLIFWVDFKDATGKLVYSSPDSTLPTPGNGQGSPEDNYGTRRYISSVKFKTRCQGNALTGTTEPIKMDNIRVSVPKVETVTHKVDLVATGEGTVTIAGTSMQNGDSIAVPSDGAPLEVVPADGYKIASVKVGDDERTITDFTRYHETLNPTADTTVTVVFEQISDQSHTATFTIAGSGKVTVDGKPVENGGTANITGSGATLLVEPSKGYEIAGVTVGTNARTIINPVQYTEKLMLAEDSAITVTFAEAAALPDNTFVLQDFEGYTVYNNNDKSGTYGAMLNKNFPAATQIAYTGAMIDGTDGLFSVKQEGENKYFEARTKPANYPVLGFGFHTPITGSDIVAEFDFDIGDNLLYIRPTFCDSTGNDPKEISSFVNITPSAIGAFYYDTEGNKNAAYLPATPKDWAKVAIHFNMESLTYRLDIKDMSGTVIASTPESPLPTNGSETPDATYGNRKHLKQIFLTARCDSNSLTGTAKPLKLDNFNMYTSKGEQSANKITLAVTGQGVVTLGGKTLANGEVSELGEGGAVLTVEPADGYEIESISVGDNARTITDRTYYTEALKISADTTLTVTFAEAAPTAKKVFFTQDFEKYTVYDKDSGTGTFGDKLTESFRNATQTAYTGTMINGTDGLYSVQQEDENKYFEARIKSGVFPNLMYSLNTPTTGDDIIFETDFMIGDTLLYIRPIFTDSTGNDVKEITNFLILTPTAIGAYYYGASGNASHQLSPLSSWAKAIVHINMEKLTYRVDFKDMSGKLIASAPESSLPTNGTDTVEATYGARKFVKQINLTTRCDVNSLTGTGKPLKLDNIALSVVKEPVKVKTSIKGSGTVLIDGKEVADGETASVRTTGTTLAITPAAGGQIASVTLNGNKLEISDLQSFTDKQYIEDDAELEVVFVRGYRVSVAISGGSGAATLNGVSLASGETIAVSDSGAELNVVPDAGFRIASILFGGESLAITDPHLYKGNLIPKGDTNLQITYESESTGAKLFVSLDGNDENDGSEEHPFATLEHARDVIRQYKEQGQLPAGGVTVYLRGGTYHLSQTFELETKDSGTAEAPILYRNYPGEKVSLSGGVDIDYSKFKPVDGEMKQLLRNSGARDKVMVGDLDEIGIGPVPEIPIVEYATLKLPLFLFDGHVLKLSQWPNSDVQIADWPVAGVINKGFCDRFPPGDPNNGTGQTKISYTTDIPSSWSHNPSDILWFGYWRYEWYAEYFYGNLDKSAKTVEATKTLLYGAAPGLFPGGNQPFKVFNVYEEIDEPGEYYIDRSANKMYFYPYETTATKPVYKMTEKDFNLVSLKDTSYITLRGIELTSGKKSGITISGGANNLIDQCDINAFEEMGANIANGSKNGISNSAVYNCGTGGVNLTGGDKDNIIAAGNFVYNTKLHDWSLLKASYGPGVQLNGVGNIVSHCEFFNAPHAAILFNGVENIMEYNIFHEVVRNAGDMGAIYTSRDLSDHGNTVRYNYFYDIGNQINTANASNAVFADDASSDMVVYGNVFGQGIKSGEALKAHGGMNNVFRNNLFVDVPKILYVVNWQPNRFENTVLKGDAGYGKDAEQAIHNSWLKIKGNQAYYDRWPWLQSMETMENFVYQSQVLGNNVFAYVNEERASNYVKIFRKLKEAEVVAEQSTNLYWKPNVANKNYFKDFDGGNFALTDEAYKVIREKIPDFEEIPFEQMGLLDIEKSLPSARLVTVTMGENRTVNASYVFDDPQQDLESDSVYRWLISDTKDGTYQPVSGATGKSYTYPESENGRYIKFEVTPKNKSGLTGITVQSAPIFLVSDAQSLKHLIDNMATVLAAAEAGSDLGQYPASAITAFSAAIQTAREAQAGHEAEAAEALDIAYEAFKLQQITSYSSNMESGTVTVPQGLRKLEINLGGVSSEILLNALGELPAGTVINAVINGVNVKVVIPNATPAGNMTLIRVPSEPGAKIFGDTYTNFQVGLAGGPIEIRVSGGAGKSAFLIKDGVAEAISGAVNDNGDKIFTIDRAGEVLVAQMYTPSSNANLSEIAVDGNAVARFSPDQESYRYTVAADGAGTVTAKAADENASVVIVQAGSIPGTAKITVTAQDGVTKKEYNVKLSRKPEPTPTPIVTPPYPGSSGNQGGTGGGANPGFGLLTEETKTTFTDIAGHWAMNDIEAMAVKGIVNGVTATTFEPDRAITRAEFATLLVKGLGLTSSATTGFMDVQTGGWYAPYVNAAANAGLIVGYDGYFRPDDLITREEMAVIIAKAYAFRGGKAAAGSIGKFADIADISDWARSYVDTVTSAGLISGMTEDTFVPQDNATRAQAVSLLKRLLDLI